MVDYQMGATYNSWSLILVQKKGGFLSVSKSEVSTEEDEEESEEEEVLEELLLLLESELLLELLSDESESELLLELELLLDDSEDVLELSDCSSASASVSLDSFSTTCTRSILSAEIPIRLLCFLCWS